MKEEQKELIYTILALLAIGTVVVAAAVVPGTLIAIAPFVAKKTRAEERRTYEALRYVQRQKWIRVAETREGIQVEITKRGRRRWQQLRFDRPLTGKRWDGKWRLVIFDIPDKKKVARDALRDILKRLGFEKLQESVWVTPWECEEHISSIKQFYGIPHHVQIVEATRVENESTLLTLFNLTR